MAWKRGQCFFQVSDKLSAELAVDAAEYAACILTATVAEVQTKSVRCSRGARGQPQRKMRAGHTDASRDSDCDTCVFPPEEEGGRGGRRGNSRSQTQQNVNSSVSIIHAI